MRTDLCMSHDDNDDVHYINFDRIIGDGLGVETGGYISVRQDTDNNVYVICCDIEGNIIAEVVLPVNALIGGA